MRVWKECDSKHDTFTPAVVFWTNVNIAFTLKDRPHRIPRSWSAIQYHINSNFFESMFIVSSNIKDVNWPWYTACCGRHWWILWCWLCIPPLLRLGPSTPRLVSCNAVFHLPVILHIYIMQSCTALSCKLISINYLVVVFSLFFFFFFSGS